MLHVFDQLTVKRSQDKDIISQVLIGSPGVGKSILFFLVAIWQAMQGNEVIYWRKTSQLNELISVFVMKALKGDNTRIRFLFDRYIPLDDPRCWHKEELCCLLGRASKYNQLEPGLYVMVDGPEHTDKQDTFGGKANYFCTFGGHPMPKSENEYCTEIVALGGWEKAALKSCLAAALPAQLSDDMFDYIYYLAGGRVRDAMTLNDANTRGRFMKSARQKVGLESVQAAALAAQTTEGSADNNSRGSFRTMFVDEDGIMFQIVDSAFKLALLTDRCNMDELLKYGWPWNSKCSQRLRFFFEELMYKWYIDKKPPPCTGYHRGSGTGVDEVGQLTKMNI